MGDRLGALEGLLHLVLGESWGPSSNESGRCRSSPRGQGVTLRELLAINKKYQAHPFQAAGSPDSPDSVVQRHPAASEQRRFDLD